MACFWRRTKRLPGLLPFFLAYGRMNAIMMDGARISNTRYPILFLYLVQTMPLYHLRIYPPLIRSKGGPRLGLRSSRGRGDRVRWTRDRAVEDRADIRRFLQPMSGQVLARPKLCAQVSAPKTNDTQAGGGARITKIKNMTHFTLMPNTRIAQDSHNRTALGHRLGQPNTRDQVARTARSDKQTVRVDQVP